MIELTNDHLHITINPHGAELTRVYNPTDNIDYLWNADPSFWKRTSPVLFPIVGAVAQNTYLHQGERYHLSQHGFARDMDFRVVSQSESGAWFELVSTAQTLGKYPFEFVLRIGYELTDTTLTVHWQVENPSDTILPFSIGAHPAFNANLGQDDSGEYDFLFFEHSEDIVSYVFDNERGLVVMEQVTIAENRKTLPLNKELFAEHPTLIIQGESAISLCSTNHEREIQVRFDGFPYVGIWSPINEQGEIAPFVCIEPWYGMADTNCEPGEISDKVGIQKLAPKGVFKTSYSMRFN